MALYGSAIAFVSGGYSLYLATTGPDMTGSAWLMLAVGLVVIVHGIVLVTPYAAAIADVSGLLMITYAAVMLLTQVWMTTMDDSGMGGMDAVNSMGSDAGMVAIAILMLASGIIMHTRRGMM
jgi:hypothetical protein